MRYFKKLLIGITFTTLSFSVLAESYVCETSATLDGILTTENSDPAMSSDEKTHPFPALKLAKGISVGCQSGDELCSTENNISVLQLSLPKTQMELFKKLKGKHAKVSGKLLHSENGNHYTAVLINVESISGVEVVAKSNGDNAKQQTVIVARNSVGAGEDGFSFKSTKGKQYYVSYNSDNMVKGADFIDDKSKKPICLKFNEPNSDNIIEVTRGACK